MKQATFFFTLLILTISCTNNETPLADYPITPVNLNNIKLTDNFWLPKIKTIQHVTIDYALHKCRAEGRMENFLIAGGRMEGETRGEMPFDDTDLYKIIEGASYSLISSPDPVLEDYIDSLISIIAIGQEEDGYLTTWKTINPEISPAVWAEPGGRWENLVTSHEMYNSGHMFEAATAHFYATGKRNFLDIALKNADLLVEVFGPDKNIEMPGHQIVETGLIKLYRISGEEKYLELAKHFLDHRGDSTLRELYGAYNQDHMPVLEQEEVVGHAVRAVYMYAGMTDIATIYKDTAYQRAVNALWENMVNKKLYITGGVGARHRGEAFGENYELPNLTAYSETCAAIGSVYWNHRLFLLTGDVKYYDILERTLYNAVISGISLEGDKFFYPNPLEADGVYDFNQGACTRQAWFDCSCCPTNLIRFVPYVPNLVYATNMDKLYINLFMSGMAEIELNTTQLRIVQETNYPWDGDVKMTVTPQESSKFTIMLRIPGWARNEVTPGELYSYSEYNKGQAALILNGEEMNIEARDGYFSVNRKWEAGDVIELKLPAKVRTVMADERIIDDRNKLAVEYGPLVYCIEEADNFGSMDEICISDQLNYKIDYMPELLGGVNVLKTIKSNESSQNEADVTLIPYFAWSNRGVGKMKVWLPTQE